MAQVDRSEGLVGNTGIKAPADLATTGNITLTGEQTIDGVLTSGSRVFVRANTDSSENGIWVSDTGAWSRALDFDGQYDVSQGTLITVGQGVTLGGSIWRVTTANPITIGTTGLSFSRFIVGDSSTLTFLQSGSGSVSRLLQDKVREIEMSVTDKGAVLNETTDDYLAIMDAINSLPARGGVIRVPGVAAIDTTITCNKRVIFDCDGMDGHHDIGTYTHRSGLKWIGAAGGTMIEFVPSVGGASDQALIGCGIRGGLTLDGNGLAAVGLRIASCRFGNVTGMGFVNFPNAAKALLLTVITGVDEAADTQHWTFDNLSFSLYGTSAIAIELDGDATANASYNNFRCVAIAHTNGTAINLKNADNCMFQTTQIVRSGGGTGIGVAFRAGASAALTARNNHFLNLSTNAGVLSEGTPTAAAAALDNTIWMYDRGNGSPIPPTIEAGSRLRWFTDQGDFNGFAGINMIAADSEAVAAVARPLLSGESLHVRNNVARHIVLSDVASTWAVKLDSGNFDIVKLSTPTSGTIRFPTPPELTGATISTAATAGTAGPILSTAAAGFLNVVINGGNYKIPLLNV